MRARVCESELRVTALQIHQTKGNGHQSANQQCEENETMALSLEFVRGTHGVALPATPLLS